MRKKLKKELCIVATTNGLWLAGFLDRGRDEVSTFRDSLKSLIQEEVSKRFVGKVDVRLGLDSSPYSLPGRWNVWTNLPEGRDSSVVIALAERCIAFLTSSMCTSLEDHPNKGLLKSALVAANR